MLELKAAPPRREDRDPLHHRRLRPEACRRRLRRSLRQSRRARPSSWPSPSVREFNRKSSSSRSLLGRDDDREADRSEVPLTWKPRATKSQCHPGAYRFLELLKKHGAQRERRADRVTGDRWAELTLHEKSSSTRQTSRMPSKPCVRSSRPGRSPSTATPSTSRQGQDFLDWVNEIKTEIKAGEVKQSWAERPIDPARKLIVGAFGFDPEESRRPFPYPHSGRASQHPVEISEHLSWDSGASSRLAALWHRPPGRAGTLSGCPGRSGTKSPNRCGPS